MNIRVAQDFTSIVDRRFIHRPWAGNQRFQMTVEFKSDIGYTDRPGTVFPIQVSPYLQNLPNITLQGSNHCLVKLKYPYVKTVELTNDADYPGESVLSVKRYLYDPVTQSCKLFRFSHLRGIGRSDHYVLPIGLKDEEQDVLDPVAHILVSALLLFQDNTYPEHYFYKYNQIKEVYQHLKKSFSDVFKLTYDFENVLEEMKFFCDTLTTEVETFQRECARLDPAHLQTMPHQMVQHFDIFMERLCGYIPSFENYSQQLGKWKKIDFGLAGTIGRWVPLYTLNPDPQFSFIDRSPSRSLHMAKGFVPPEIESDLTTDDLHALIYGGGALLNVWENLPFTDGHIVYRIHPETRVMQLHVNYVYNRFASLYVPRNCASPEMYIGMELCEEFMKFYERQLGDPRDITEIEFVWNYDDEGLIIVEIPGLKEEGWTRSFYVDFNSLSMLVPIFALDSTPFSRKYNAPGISGELPPSRTYGYY